MTESLVFAPLVDLRLIWGLMVLAMALLGFALWKGLRGWPFRALAFAVLALVGGTAVSLLMARQARDSAGLALASERRALDAAEETRRALYAATMLRVYDDLHEGSPLAASR